MYIAPNPNGIDMAASSHPIPLTLVVAVITKESDMKRLVRNGNTN